MTQRQPRLRDEKFLRYLRRQPCSCGFPLSYARKNGLMSDVYAPWRERLANAALPKKDRRKILTYENVVNPGFYRKRLTEKTPGGATKTIGYEPVAFWIEGDGDARELVGMIGGRSLNAAQCEAEWLYVCDKPISE